MAPITYTLGELHEHLMEQVRETVYPPGRKVQVALASCCIVAEHHLAIALLVDEKLYASAFSLSRALYEAAVKGLWLSHCATEEAAEAFACGKELDQMNELLDHLSSANLPAVVLRSLANVKRKYWRVLSSLTHSGHAQVKRWLSPDGVEPTYTDEMVQELVNFTAFFAVVAAYERAHLGGNLDSMQRIAAMLPAE